MGFTCVMAVRYVCNKHDFLCAGISFNQILEHARVASCLMNSGYKKYALLSVKGAWSGDLWRYRAPSRAHRAASMKTHGRPIVREPGYSAPDPQSFEGQPRHCLFG